VLLLLLMMMMAVPELLAVSGQHSSLQPPFLPLSVHYAFDFLLPSPSPPNPPTTAGAPLVLGAVLMVPALAIAASIPTNAGGSAGVVGRQQLSWLQMKTFTKGFRPASAPVGAPEAGGGSWAGGEGLEGYGEGGHGEGGKGCAERDGEKRPLL